MLTCYGSLSRNRTVSGWAGAWLLRQQHGGPASLSARSRGWRGCVARSSWRCTMPGKLACRFPPILHQLLAPACCPASRWACGWDRASGCPTFWPPPRKWPRAWPPQVRWLGTRQAGHGGRGMLRLGERVCYSPHRRRGADRVILFASGALLFPSCLQLLLTTPAHNSQQCRDPHPCAAVVVNLARKYRVQLPVLTAVAQVRCHVPVGLSTLGWGVAGQGLGALLSLGGHAVAPSATVCARHWCTARCGSCTALWHRREVFPLERARSKPPPQLRSISPSCCHARWWMGTSLRSRPCLRS